MSTLSETILISLCMIVPSALSLLLPAIRKRSKLFYLLGTGALIGILFFHLLPDLIHRGGNKSLFLVGLVWLAYSVFHLIHLKSHKKECSHESNTGTYFFLASIITHSIASGVLLVISETFTTSMRQTIFTALLFHKIYESLTVSSILIEKEKSRGKAIFLIVLYALSLPAGAYLTTCYRNVINTEFAVWITGLGIGTLLSCLIYDFLLPSLHRLQNRRSAIKWIAVGLLTTQLAMNALCFS